MKKEILIFGIIFLFIGVGIQPAFAIDISKTQTSNSNDLVEITLQLCKTDGVEDHKMFITQEQDEKLNLLIENFKQDIEISESYEETVEIYKDMIVSLDELGLLPNYMSIKEAQRLVTGRSNRFSNLFSLLEQFYKSKKTSGKEVQEQNRGDVYENSDCLTSSDASLTTYTSTYDGTPLQNLIHFLLFILSLGMICIAQHVYYGEIWYPTHGYPSNGWIHTASESIKWTCQGEFHGGMGDFQIFFHPLHGAYRGIKDFKGLKIKDFILGRAEQVKINGWAP